MTQLTIRCVSSTTEFSDMKDAWTRLLASSRCDTLFMSWEWQYTWWMNLSGKRQLLILLVYDGVQLVAIAPLALRPVDFSRLLPFKALEIMGAGNVGSDYLSIIVQEGFDNRALSGIAAWLIANSYVLEFSNTDRNSAIMTKAALKMRNLGCRTARSTQSFSPYVDMSADSWESYMAAGESRFNKKFRRMQRDHHVRFEQTVAEDSRSADLSILIDLHLKRWSGRGGSNAFDTAELRLFHERFSKQALENNWLRLFILWLDDKPAAAVYGFFYKNTCYYYQAGFDPAFGQYSVGYLAIGLIIKQAFDEGAKEFDMLHGEEEYKYAWANNEREIVRLSIYPPSLKGFLCAKAMDIRTTIKTCVTNKTRVDLQQRYQA